MSRRNLEICFTPALYHLYEKPDIAVVVVDIFRATTAICTAFDYGVKQIIPVAKLEEAIQFKKQGYLIAAERDGIKIDFADFGNSPFNFMQEGLEGTTIVYSTTNGTQAIHRASGAKQVLIGSFLNLSAMTEYLCNADEDVVILCAGWKDRFSLEDALYAGALADKLLASGDFKSECDSVTSSIDLWNIAKPDLLTYQKKFAHSHRLKTLMLDDVIEFCLTPDQNDRVPRFKDGIITMVSN